MQKAIDSAQKIDIEKTWINTLNEEIFNDLNNKKITTQLGLINGGKIIDRDHDYNQFLYNRIAYLNLYMALAISDNGEDTIETLMNKADELMYIDKVGKKSKAML